MHNDKIIYSLEIDKDLDNFLKSDIVPHLAIVLSMSYYTNKITGYWTYQIKKFNGWSSLYYHSIDSSYYINN